MQFKILLTILLSSSTFAIPVSNAGPDASNLNKDLTTEISTNTIHAGSTSWFSPLQKRSPGTFIQQSINMCRTGHAQFLGQGDEGNAWKTEVETYQFVLKVTHVAVLPDKMAKELHNLLRVDQLVEWGQITKNGKTVYYILMHYMGMTAEELLEIKPNLRGFGGVAYFTNVMAELRAQYYHEGMDHQDVKRSNLAFLEHTENGKTEISPQLIDWGMANDLKQATPTTLDVPDIKQWKREIVDDKMGDFPKNAAPKHAGSHNH
ncbi:hypothetical protein H0H93_014928 [Arthromyces matolae]|nr:hypothetical protein H0H93_014928 [Arthromyces matolae]